MSHTFSFYWHQTTNLVCIAIDFGVKAKKKKVIVVMNWQWWSDVVKCQHGCCFDYWTKKT
jgi:hypothetical protein